MKLQVQNALATVRKEMADKAYAEFKDGLLFCINLKKRYIDQDEIDNRPAINLVNKFLFTHSDHFRAYVSNGGSIEKCRVRYLRVCKTVNGEECPQLIDLSDSDKQIAKGFEWFDQRTNRWVYLCVEDASLER